MTIPFRPVARAASGSTGGEKAEMARRSRGSHRGGVVPRGKITNPCLPPQRASLRTAVREWKVGGILIFPFRTTPRRGRRGRARPPGAPGEKPVA